MTLLVSAAAVGSTAGFLALSRADCLVVVPSCSSGDLLCEAPSLAMRCGTSSCSPRGFPLDPHQLETLLAPCLRGGGLGPIGCCWTSWIYGDKVLWTPAILLSRLPSEIRCQVVQYLKVA